MADQAAKLSVEEHMLFTTVETLQKDLDLGSVGKSFLLFCYVNAKSCSFRLNYNNTPLSIITLFLLDNYCFLSLSSAKHTRIFLPSVSCFFYHQKLLTFCGWFQCGFQVLFLNSNILDILKFQSSSNPGIFLFLLK